MTDLTLGDCAGPGRDGLAVVTPPPQIDLTNADRLRRSLTAAAAEYPVVVVGMTANELCDSSGIRAPGRRPPPSPGQRR